MNKNRTLKIVLSASMLLIFLIIVIMALPAPQAIAQGPQPTPTESLTTCKLTENCTAKDFGTFIVDNVVVNQSGCRDTNGDGIKEVNLSFDITYPSNQPERYDIGSILALDGLEPLRDLADLPGICTRDYLAPPLTTTLETDNTWPNALGEFWDGEESGDMCGDLPPSNSATRSYTNVDIACVDRDSDGRIDISLCLYYDNNAKPDCYEKLDATTGTTAKCQCQTVNIPVSPTAITIESLKAGSALSTGKVISLAVVLSVVSLSGFWLVWRSKRRMSAK